jgi:tRNA-2-methylthio-N6-dimethylallyladenosine synthase
MNVADSERMLGSLVPIGFALTQSPEQADLILLNTCNIREKARHKFSSRLGVLRVLKNARPHLRIVVGGCVAQAEGESLLKEVPEIDIVMGPARLEELPRLLEERERAGHAIVARNQSSGCGHDHDHDHDHDHAHDHSPHSGEGSDEEIKPASGPVEESDVFLPSVTGKEEVSRFVNIMQGCNNHCTFCVVPLTRGPERSRSEAEVLREVETLVRGGAREITLLGQNVNSYGLTSALSPEVEPPFARLLRRVAGVEGLKRLRFTTSNPHDFSPAVARLFGEMPELGRYMHLPLQSGSDRILAAMKRKVTASEYLERISWLRAIDPDFAVSSDIIVGFPGETEEDFLATLDIVRRVRFSFLFAFKYSSRRNTAAARFSDQISEEVKEERLARLNALQDQITEEQQRAQIGKVHEALFMYRTGRDGEMYVGKTADFRQIRTRAGRDIIGQILPVRVTGGNKISLNGDLE